MRASCRPICLLIHHPRQLSNPQARSKKIWQCVLRNNSGPCALRQYRRLSRSEGNQVGGSAGMKMGTAQAAVGLMDHALLPASAAFSWKHYPRGGECAHVAGGKRGRGGGDKGHEAVRNQLSMLLLKEQLLSTKPWFLAAGESSSVKLHAAGSGSFEALLLWHLKTPSSLPVNFTRLKRVTRK